MSATLRKWWAVFAVSIQDTVAYRASLVIWILTDLTTAIVMPLLWASAGKSGAIGGMSTGDFVVYYLAILQLGAFVTSHMMWDVAFEIKEGIFSVYLVRPIGFYPYMFFRNFAWRTVRAALTVPFFFGLLLLFRPLMDSYTIYVGWEFWVAVLLGHVASFLFVMAMGMIALFVQEAYSVFELYYVPQLFLSGYLFPIHLLPDWASALAKAFPFYYTVGAPTEILTGRVSGAEAHRAIALQIVWISVCFVAGMALWKKGLKHYTGVGM